MAFPAIDPADVGATGLLWLFISYGYILYYASNLISEGSDLLLLVPSMAGLVGSVVLPMLGAVPDGAIMLFSGLGDISKAQETLSIGVGALAGSTIMLMTIPFSLSVFAGRVDMKPDEVTGRWMPNYLGKPKLHPNQSCGHALTRTGIAIADEVKIGGVILFLTSVPYFMIQVPGMFIHGPTEEVAEGEKYWALAGLIVCLLGFVSYLYYQFRKSDEGAARLKRVQVTKEMMKKGKVSLSGALYKYCKNKGGKGGGVKGGTGMGGNSHSSYQAVDSGDGAGVGVEMKSTPPPEVQEYLADILHEAFVMYDLNKSGTLDRKEFRAFLRDSSESITNETIQDIFDRNDINDDGHINFAEFIQLCYNMILQSGVDAAATQKLSKTDQVTIQEMFDDEVEEEEEGSEEEEDLPPDITNLSPKEQQAAIKKRAFVMLFIGTTLAVLFSDPLVGVLDEVASRIGIPAFYVAFVLAPLGSNASEVIASQYYAAKKTRKSISVALTALEGAGAMSNTFCLSIFMGLVYFRGLAWQYTAETVAIVAVEYVIGLMVQADKLSTLQGLLILAIYPLSLLFVATLEAYGID